VTNRPKQIGTAGESVSRNWLVDDGWAECHRIAQTGTADQGDLLICSVPFKAIAEVKAGAQAEAASPLQINKWLDETETERRNAGAAIAALIIRRYRRGPANWDVWLRLKDIVWLETGDPGWSDIPVRISLADFSALLRFAVGEWEAGDRP
jgi:hypothetical protein